MSCGRKRGRRGKSHGDEDKDVRLSKSLSYVLRHGANQMGFQMSADGFIFLEDLLANPQFCSYSVDDVKRVVETNDKQRFKLQPHPENGRLQIRANQGHSVQVEDLELKPVLAGSPDCPSEAVHGSYLRNWNSIQQHGLSRMKRTHIHLAPGLPGEEGVISGMRRDCDLAIFIDVTKALSDGIQFFWSDNGVLLTAGDTQGKLLPKYFIRALRLRPTRNMLPLQ
uniref:2'-phosphotransferase n=1 Tax=Neogobius melanostomus TaxID=47308 RepID=A0A8C6U509_9GOBI